MLNLKIKKKKTKTEKHKSSVKKDDSFVVYKEKPSDKLSSYYKLIDDVEIIDNKRIFIDENQFGFTQEELERSFQERLQKRMRMRMTDEEFRKELEKEFEEENEFDNIFNKSVDECIRDHLIQVMSGKKHITDKIDIVLEKYPEKKRAYVKIIGPILNKKMFFYDKKYEMYRELIYDYNKKQYYFTYIKEKYRIKK